AAAKLLQDAGWAVEVPVAQTCCGGSAPGRDGSDQLRTHLKSTIKAVEGLDDVVAPSGSCADMLKRQCETVFADDPAWQHRAMHLADRVHELTAFLVDVLGVSRVGGRMNGSVTYHDTCCGVAGPCAQEQPRALLRSVAGIRLKEPETAAGCCGL